MNENKPGLTSLKEIITSLLNDSGLSIKPEDAAIWRVWDDTVGPAVAGNARPQRIKDGLLRVTVTEPIWLQELGLVEKSIRDKLNEKLGRAAVERIEFRLRSK